MFVVHIEKIGKKKIIGDCSSLPCDRKLHLLPDYTTASDTHFPSVLFLLHARNMQLLLDYYSFSSPTKKSNFKSKYEGRVCKKAERHLKKI